MTRCLDCKKILDPSVEKASINTLGIPLCSHHQNLIHRLMKLHETPLEAIQLYYGLKEAGAAPMLEWWDGLRSVDIALSRVKLNLEIDTEYQMFTSDQTLTILEERMYNYKNGFTTIRIPHMLIRQCLTDTIDAVLGIMEGLRARSQAV
jgi:hypothetical protein